MTYFSVTTPPKPSHHCQRELARTGFGHTAGCYMAGIDYASIAADRLQAQVQGLFICGGVIVECLECCCMQVLFLRQNFHKILIHLTAF